MLRRQFCLGSLAGAVWTGSALPDPARAQGHYPSRPVTLVVPYAPGGSSDIMARILSNGLNAAWGQPVVVENRGGGTTTVGTEYVARLPPDGHAMLLAPPPFVIAPFIYRNLGYDPVRDFTGVSLVAFYPLVLVVPAASPVNSLGELVAAARARPGMAYPSPGAGTTPHLFGELLARRERLELTHVPYRSGGQGVADLIGERLQFYAGPTTEVVPHVQAGRLKAIAVLAEARSAVLPGVPTARESGFEGLDASSWTTVAMAAATPPAMVAKVSADIAAITRQPEVRQRMEAQGAVFVGSSPTEASAFWAAERLRWGPLITDLNITPNG
ncbi:Bug family tripartite tricarboxylate transporter substrate binding protein [Roseomonas populi]|uniref:Tripartite tricarboxylate transporter substrate-binding protein n=1 Tax=Roseomonas populi TaxID=3121582 RepID=A0ABT1X6P4_9PROT|nr:tripartite tricarboxylate transporter substrate-binding protein [Roseomonas pecuniae]MCR0983774.1 tripartite tricarboxylate transporter substrate-binding protein [Roseomonas pecuniae]